MHFITGGAYNGKRKWVKNYYALASIQHLWLTAYDTDVLTKPPDEKLPSIVVLEGLEQWVYTQIEAEIPPDALRETMMNLIEPWLQWDNQRDHQRLVVIGCDISRGIVPIDKHDRLTRDVTGWIYQELVQRAARADVIWYGVEQTMKGTRTGNENFY